MSDSRSCGRCIYYNSITNECGEESKCMRDVDEAKYTSYIEGKKQGRADQKKEDNEFFNFEGAWELEKQKVRAEVISEISREMRVLYGNEYEKKIKEDAIEEYKNRLWEDIETRYKNDIKILGYLSAENLLRDVHNAICYFAEQLKEQSNAKDI